MRRLLLTLNLFAATAIGASNGSAMLAAISPYRAGAAAAPAGGLAAGGPATGGIAAAKTGPTCREAGSVPQNSVAKAAAPSAACPPSR